MKYSIFSLVAFLLAINCVPQSKPIELANADLDYMIYLSHTRLNKNDSILKEVYGLEFDLFDLTLLGGDLGNKTFEGKLIHELDSLFHFASPNTLWSIGNHDNTTNNNFKKYTKRDKFFRYVKNNTTFMVIDSQDSLSSIVGPQKDFFMNAIDSVSTKNVVVLSHKLIFMDKDPVMDPKINSICNGVKGDCYYCHNPNNFRKDIYPKLKELREKGINVYWIGGDLGVKAPSFEYKDSNGIVFLGNGCWFKNEDNKVLLLSSSKTGISYRFIPIDVLVQNQNADFIEQLFMN